MKNNSFYDPKNLHMIFMALFFMQLFITSLVVYLLPPTTKMSFSIFDLTNWAVPAFTLSLVVWGRRQFNLGLIEVAELEEWDEKFKLLTLIHIRQWIAVEFGTLLLMSYALIEKNFFYFTLGLVNLIYFYTLRPKLFSFSEGI